MAKLNESSEFTIPLKNLLALIAATAISVWAYFGIMERLAFIEHDISMMQIEVEENDNWIDEFKPPPAVMDSVERVRQLEIKIKELELKLKFFVASRRG
jgi:heme oxygenase